jgi:hypothetical protein
MSDATKFGKKTQGILGVSWLQVLWCGSSNKLTQESKK